MRPLNRILVAVDFSEASKAALVEADYIALWGGGELHVVHVIAIDEANPLMKIETPNEEVFAGMRRKLKNFTESSTNLCEKRIYHVCVGNPFNQIMKLVEMNDSDLLVVGSEGGDEEESNYVGAIASKCIRRSRIPVLLVRRRRGAGYKSLVVCVDFSDASKEAVEYAAEIAYNENAELHILHVWCDPWEAYSFPVEGVNRPMVKKQLEAAKTIAERGLKKMRAQILREYLAANVSTAMVEASSVSKGIVDFINERETTDLVAIGTHGHSKITEFFIGTTAERIIRKSPCSILTVGAAPAK